MAFLAGETHHLHPVSGLKSVRLLAQSKDTVRAVLHIQVMARHVKDDGAGGADSLMEHSFRAKPPQAGQRTKRQGEQIIRCGFFGLDGLSIRRPNLNPRQLMPRVGNSGADPAHTNDGAFKRIEWMPDRSPRLKFSARRAQIKTRQTVGMRHIPDKSAHFHPIALFHSGERLFEGHQASLFHFPPSGPAQDGVGDHGHKPSLAGHAFQQHNRSRFRGVGFIPLRVNHPDSTAGIQHVGKGGA